MRALDTSLLAYAANRHAPEHARAARVVETLANGETPWALPWSVAHEFLQLVTHPHAVARALAPADAWGFVEALLASHSVRLLGPTEAHAAALAEVIASLPPGSGVPPGLETAVLLREHGVRELLSADRGMRRFAFLSVRDPLHGEAWSPAERPARRYRVLRPRAAKG
jgi:toxin-antitoxin system PIN domain toxin